MNWNRYATALVVSFFAALIFDVLLNGVLLRGAFAAAATYWRPADELFRLIPVGWLSMLVTMACFGLLYVRGGWHGLKGGLEFGAWLSLAGAAGVLGMMSLVPWPLELVGGMTLQQAGNAFLLGACFGWLYKRREA